MELISNFLLFSSEKENLNIKLFILNYINIKYQILIGYIDHNLYLLPWKDLGNDTGS